MSIRSLHVVLSILVAIALNAVLFCALASLVELSPVAAEPDHRPTPLVIRLSSAPPATHPVSRGERGRPGERPTSAPDRKIEAASPEWRRIDLPAFASAPSMPLPGIALSAPRLPLQKSSPLAEWAGKAPSPGKAKNIEDGPTGGPPSPLAPVLDADRVDRAPRQIVHREPTYPLPARRTGREGSVLIEFVIDESGHVRDPVVLKVTGFSGFGPAVLEAAPGWLFSPARHRDRPVAVRARKTVHFRIDSG